MASSALCQKEQKRMFEQFHQRLKDLRLDRARKTWDEEELSEALYNYEQRLELEWEMRCSTGSAYSDACDHYKFFEDCEDPTLITGSAKNAMSERDLESIEKFEQRVHAAENAEEVFVISAPHNAKAARAAVLVANTLKQRGNKVFVFDPNVDMEVFAQSLHQFDKNLQDKRWLQIWTDFVLYAATKGSNHSGVIFLCDGMPTSTDLHEVDEKLPGNAQHGEYRIALLAGFNDQKTGLHFVDINRPVLAIP